MCEAKITEWIYSKPVTYPFVWSYLIMIVGFIECWVTWQTADVLNAAKLVQNSPDRKIHMELINSSYLRQQCQAHGNKDLSRNSTTLSRTENRKVELLRLIFHVRASKPRLWFSRSVVPEFYLLEDFSEFCHKEGVWGHVNIYVPVEYFFRLGAAFVISSAGIGCGVLVFIGDNW